MIPKINASGPGIGVLDSRYLKLDASNDPVTGPLSILTTNDTVGPLTINVDQTNGGTSSQFIMSVYTTAQAPAFIFQRATNTLAVPQTLAATNRVLTMSQNGYNGNGVFQTTTQILFEVDGTSGNTLGGRMRFYTSLVDGTITEAMRINDDQQVTLNQNTAVLTIGTATPLTTSVVSAATVFDNLSGTRKVFDASTASFTPTAATSGQLQAMDATATIDTTSSGFNFTNSIGALGFQGKVTINGTGGTVTGVRGGNFIITNAGSATITTAVTSAFLATQNTGGGAVTSCIGVMIADQTVGGTNNTNLLVGSTSTPSGSYNIYAPSTKDNYFGGDTTINTDLIVVSQAAVGRSTVVANTQLYVDGSFSGTVGIGVSSVPTVTLSGNSASSSIAFNGVLELNQNGFNATSTQAGIGFLCRVNVTGDTGTVTGAVGATYQVVQQGDATITLATGNIVNNNVVSGGTGTITSSIGLAIANQTGGSTNNSNLVIGQVTAPTGDFSIYNSSTRDNYFAGSLGIKTTPASGVNFHVSETTNGDMASRFQNGSGGTSARVFLQFTNNTPASGYLMVTGSNYTGVAGWGDRYIFNSDAALTGGILIRPGAGGFQVSANGTNNANFYVNSSTGFVGVGTTSPGSTFTVDGTAATALFTTNTTNGITLESKTTSATNNILRLRALGTIGGASATGRIRFVDNDGSSDIITGDLVAAHNNAAGSRYFGFIANHDRDGERYPVRFFTETSAGTATASFYIGADADQGKVIVGNSTTTLGVFSVYGQASTDTAVFQSSSGATPNIVLKRNDTTVTSAESLGMVQFATNDATVTTAAAQIGGYIEVRANAAFTTDAAQSNMFFGTKSTATGAAPDDKLVLTHDGRLYGLFLHNNAGAVTGTTNQYIASGTYTPGLTNVANVAASTAYKCQWIRVGNVVTVTGKADVDPTLAATSTQLGIALPIASNLATAQDCSGTAAASGIAGQSAAILGDATNNRAQMQWVSGDITNQAMYFTFTYEII